MSEKAEKESPPGLLSKVAKFVRNPTTNWADLDRQEPEQDQGYSKQALKEMIERKRQNDFVRKREFDQLRKLRQRGPGAVNPDLARPSFFQTSMPANSDERAMTIKKIDEIEAQMSNQWWQGKQPGRPGNPETGAAQEPMAAPPAPSTHPSAGTSKAHPDLLDDAYAPTRLAPMREEALHLDGQDFPPTFPPTRPNSTFGRYPGASSLPTPSQMELPSPAEELPRAAQLPPAPPPAAKAPARAFAHSQPFAADLAQNGSDPELEEAAIRFANGDNAGAEAGLMAALQGRALRREQIDGWHAALFDLYRATGQQAAFDTAAIAYAESHGRSAPAWFSMPDRLAAGQGGVVRTQPTQLVEEPTWRSPALLDRSALDALQLAAANHARWYLDWRGLQRLSPDAVAPLAQLFAGWCDTAVQLRFAGADRLEQVLQAIAPSGDPQVNRVNWQLRMDALRVMRQQDAFELVALDYCVTFEVSPPPWQDALCGFYRDADASTAFGEVSLRDAPTSSAVPWTSSAMGLEGEVPVVQLAGEILGEAADALDRLEQARAGASQVVVSCANLIRVDFSAAGSLLNWAAMRQAEGCHLQFRDVHRLVAAFFQVIGIHEHARVVVRNG